MEGEKGTIQTLESSCLYVNEIETVTQNINFPHSESLVESGSSVIAVGNDSSFLETFNCFGVLSNCIKASKTLSEVSFSNSCTAHINMDEHAILSKADSVILESESIAGNSSKLTRFRDIEQYLNENSGSMTFDFITEENVREFEGNEFQCSSDFFYDPSFLNFLDNASSSTVPSNSSVVRNSLYQKFDPLYINHFSQDNTRNEQLSTVKDEINAKTEKFPNTFTFNNVQNKGQCNASLRQSTGNMLISFDTPIIDKRKISLSDNESVCDSEKLYTEEDLRKALENQEFAIRGTFLRKQKHLEESFLKRMKKFETEFEKQKCISNSLYIILKEAMHLVNIFSDRKETLELKVSKAEKDKFNLKEDLDTFVRDLQNIEHTFSDFHKEFKQSTTMLKLYIKNENLMKQLENINTQLTDKENMYKEIHNRSLEIIDRSNIDITSPNKPEKV